jgi:hypothetical protein
LEERIEVKKKTGLRRINRELEEREVTRNWKKQK